MLLFLRDTQNVTSIPTCLLCKKHGMQNARGSVPKMVLKLLWRVFLMRRRAYLNGLACAVTWKMQQKQKHVMAQVWVQPKHRTISFTSNIKHCLDVWPWAAAALTSLRSENTIHSSGSRFAPWAQRTAVCSFLLQNSSSLSQWPLSVEAAFLFIYVFSFRSSFHHCGFIKGSNLSWMCCFLSGDQVLGVEECSVFGPLLMKWGLKEYVGTGLH